MSEILVDEQDKWMLDAYTWRLNQDGYVVTNSPRGLGQRKSVFLHHMIVGQPIWEGEEIDHTNRNKLDNRRENLRYVSFSQNRINVTREQNQAGARNVYVKDGRYVVRVRRDRIEHYLGAFDTLDEAVAERDQFLCLSMKSSSNHYTTTQ